MGDTLRQSTRGGFISNTASNRTGHRAAIAGAFLTVLALLRPTAAAQSVADRYESTRTASVEYESGAKVSQALLPLPDAPGMSGDYPSADTASADALSLTEPSATAGSVAHEPSASLPEASHYQKYIEPGQSAPTLTRMNKAVLGVKDAFSPFAGIGWLASAGFEQLVNGSPNFGTDRGAFGQRLGAAAIRDASEGILSDSLMSPIMHEDPRYYRLGPTHNFFFRAAYAATRPIVTRTDGGRTSPNFALIAGNVAGAALTNAYYPQLNRGPSQTMQTLAGSLEGSAVGDIVGEFFDDLLQLFHASHK